MLCYETVSQRCEGAGVETPFDIMGLEDDERDRLLDMPQSKMGDVANFCNAFPNVEMDFEVQESDDITAGDPVTLVVSLEREGEEDEDEPEGGWGKVSALRLCRRSRFAWSCVSCGGTAVAARGESGIISRTHGRGCVIVR